ncbi:MAG TPA: multiheme c-type cytochrome [Terriglobia bacterium]|nr:multiheme c-type cytochrome [Terriglobia bacterium]
MSRRLSLVLLLFIATSMGWSAELPVPSSAEFCGDCHRAIEEGWKQSAHSQAVESRLFQDAMKLAETDYGASARKTCLSCHSPIAVQSGDMALVKKVSWEGITCDYCHSIRDVTLTGPNPKVTVDYSLVKSGPWKDVDSPAHGTVFSSVHTSSLICASCHEYRNSLGFLVLSTYSEWSKSAYGANNQSCQSCHMYQVQGNVVDPRVQRTAQAGINLHQIPGSHSMQQLEKALHAQLSATHQSGRLQVVVEVTNRGAGHSVPTGSPMRQLILEVRADPYGGAHMSDRRVFRRTVADAKDATIEREPQAFIKGAKEISDTRILPGETRKETFTFQVPQGTRTQVEADFIYYYSPMATTEAQQQIKFLSLRRLVE